MSSSPNQQSTGTQYELRMAASNLEFDSMLSQMSRPTVRSDLPGYLFLYSEKTFQLSPQDRDIDGHSFSETQFRGFKMKVNNHQHNKYGLSTAVEKTYTADREDELRIRIATQLGVQAASEILISPFFTADEKSTGIISMYYSVPAPISGRAMETAFGRLSDYLEQKPRGIVDELMLVENALRERFVRQRVRPATAIVPPIPIVQPDHGTDVEVLTIEDVG